MVRPPEITLRHAQGEVFNDPARFRILVAGRRFGKTYLAAVETLLKAVERPGTYWYLAPTYRMAKDLAWANLKRLVPPLWVRSKNESELRIELLNGSVLELKGAEYADALRGRSLTGVILDEAAVMKREVWFEVIRPALADQQGWALFITTPKGTASWFYDLYCFAQGLADTLTREERLQAPSSSQWSVRTYTTIDGGNVSPVEVAAARAELDERTFRQEFEASFENLSGLVCASFGVHNIANVEDDPSLPLYVGLDFNVDPLVAVFGVRTVREFHDVDRFGTPYVTRKSELHIFHEIALHGGATTWDVADYIYKTFGEERKIEVMPDPTGIRLQTSGIGISDHTILRKAGLRVIAPKSPWKVKDKVNALNSGFKTGDGASHIFISPACKELIQCLRSWTYSEGANVPDKKLGNDHFPDALGYLCLSRFNKAHNHMGQRVPYRVW